MLLSDNLDSALAGWHAAISENRLF
eukprot:COSAG01_NODE_61843_length_287_cov_1.361702_1_plen_24_part_10